MELPSAMPTDKSILSFRVHSKRMTNAAIWQNLEKACRGRRVDGAGSDCSGCARGSGTVVARDPRDTAHRAERGGGIRRFHLAATRRRQCLPACLLALLAGNLLLLSSALVV